MSLINLLILICLLPITFRGDWSTADKLTVYRAVSDVKNYVPCLGQVTFVSGNVSGYDAYTNGNTITMEPGKVTKKLVVHELGHVIGEEPAELLASGGVYDEKGNKITGAWIDGYSRYLGWSAPFNGYMSDSFTAGYQMHPRTIANWNNASEDWADMFLNYIYDTFAPNPAGDALYQWVEDYTQTLCP